MTVCVRSAVGIGNGELLVEVRQRERHFRFRISWRNAARALGVEPQDSKKEAERSNRHRDVPTGPRGQVESSDHAWAAQQGCDSPSEAASSFGIRSVWPHAGAGLRESQVYVGIEQRRTWQLLVSGFNYSTIGGQAKRAKSASPTAWRRFRG